VWRHQITSVSTSIVYENYRVGATSRRSRYQCVYSRWIQVRTGCLTRSLKAVLTGLSSFKHKSSKSNLGMDNSRLSRIGLVEFNFLCDWRVILLLRSWLKPGNICNSWLWTPNSKVQIQESKLEKLGLGINEFVRTAQIPQWPTHSTWHELRKHQHRVKSSLVRRGFDDLYFSAGAVGVALGQPWRVFNFRFTSSCDPE
jgi:hypothetical protein